MDQENIWVTIDEFPNYQITKDGRVRNIKSGKERKPSVGKRGYYVLSLRKDKKFYLKTLHRLIAITFIPNPQNKPEVNHIDGNKLNCSLENLEWVTRKENDRHARVTGLHTSDGDKMIGQFKDGVLIQTYKSISAAARQNGYNRTLISGCVNHRKNKGRKPLEKYKGYEWRQI